MEQINKMIPELRFPEFVNDGEWIEEKLGVLSNVIIGGTPSTTVEEYWNGNIGWIGSGELKNDLIKSPTKYITELGLKKSSTYLLPKNTTVLAMTGATLGKIGYLTFECCGNQSVAGFINLKNLNSKYLYYQLQNHTKQIFSFAGGGAQAGINKYNIENILLQVPKNIDEKNKEQQKIADCLTSLDELITAHTDKLENLKSHKKGLLQNLFPDPSTSSGGQKVPNYRFPEFLNDGEWVEITVENLIDKNIIYAPKDGNHGNLHPKSSDYVKEGVPFIMASDISNGKIDLKKCVFLKKEQADSLQKGFSNFDDILLTHKGTVGEVAINDIKDYPYIMLTPQVTYYRIKNSKKLFNKFLAKFFVSDSFQKQLSNLSGGGTRAYVGITEQKKLIITKPSNIKEQQKIADCLSAVDNLITAQTEKIEQLKNHKKGLMQGLFPQIEN